MSVASDIPVPADYVRVELPEALGLTAAAPLARQLLGLRGVAVALDASKVERLGALCLQVLLSARLTWRRDGAPLVLAGASSAFTEAWALFGAPAFSPVPE